MARICVSSIIGAPAGAGWERVRRFNGLAERHSRMPVGRVGNGEHQD